MPVLTQLEPQQRAQQGVACPVGCPVSVGGSGSAASKLHAARLCAGRRGEASGRARVCRAADTSGEPSKDFASWTLPVKRGSAA